MKASQLTVVATAALLTTLSGCATDPIPASAAMPVSMENHLLYKPQHWQGPSVDYNSGDYSALLDKAVEGAREAASRETPTVPVTVVRDQGGFASQGCSARVLVNDHVAAYVANGAKR